MTECTRKLLDDKPTNEDAFSGGGHRRVAGSLARTINDLDTRDAVIGLDGNWGSGKSSVIEIAREKLSDIVKDQKFYVMTFDLWTNQSLFFRRAFLEQFIAWARNEKDLNNTKKKDEFLEEQAKLIGGREQVIETKIKAHFNLLGAVFVLMLPLLPVVYAWLSPFAIKPTTIPACIPDCAPITRLQFWLVTHGTELSLAILGVLLLCALIKFILLFWESGKPLESIKQLAGLVERKTEDNIVRKLIRDVDPSNTEFSETFREILAQLQTTKKRIVIVFDNVDRLNMERASLAWSDMQAVLLRQSEAPIERVLTAVVPYDRDVIAQALFGNSGPIPALETPSIIDPQDIFRKSFDAIHHVPPAVISDVDLFVRTQLLKALGTQIDDDTKNRVARVFDLFGGTKSKTPRQVTAFVNEIATLWVAWEGEIPLDAIAVFVSNRSEIEVNRSASSIGSVCRGPFGYRVNCTPAELEEYLSMLTFSAPKEMAMQVALLNPIRTNLVVKTSAIFKDELSKSPAFPMMLGRVIDNNAEDIANNLSEFENAIGNLGSLDTNIDYVEAAILKLSEEIPRLDPAGDPEDVHLYPNTLKLPALLPDFHVTATTIALSEWLSHALKTPTSERHESHGKYWIQAIAQIRDAVIARTGDPKRWLSLQKKIGLPQGQAFVYGAAVEADNHDLSFDNFSASGRFHKHDEYLLEKISNPDAQLVHPFKQICSFTSGRAAKAVIPKFIETINSITAQKTEDTEILQSLVSLYPILVSKLERKATKIKTEELVNNGAIFTCLEKLGEGQENWMTEDISKLIVLILDALRTTPLEPQTAAYQNHPNLGNVTKSITWFNSTVLNGKHDQERVANLADATQSLNLDFQFIYFASHPDEVNENFTLYQQLGQELLKRDAAIQLVDKDFLDCFSGLVALDVAGAIAYGEAKDAANSAWSKIEPLELEIDVINSISNEASQNWPNLLKKIDTELSERTPEEWFHDLSSNTNVPSILENRLSYGGLKFPTAQLKKPSLDHLVAIATSEQAPVDELSTVLSYLSASSLKTIRREFLENLAGKPVEGSNLSKLHEAAPEFLPKLDYCAIPKVAFEKVLLPLLDAPSATAAELIQASAKPLSKMIKELGDEASQQVSELLGTMADVKDFDKVKVSEWLGITIEQTAD